MNKKVFLIGLGILMGLNSQSQYYYKDIVSNIHLLAEMANLKEQKIKLVTLTSFEGDGMPSDGFIIKRNINKNYRLVEAFTRSNLTGPSLFTSTFTKDGLLIQTIDSSDLAVNTSNYFYNDKNKIKSIQSHIHSSDDNFTNEITEAHYYQYNAEDLLQKMLIIKNNRDSCSILFSLDENKNISIEKDTKTGKSFYYYYDSKRRLTDVVHVNQLNKKMVPDYIFEYNNTDQITQMTSTEEYGSDYYIWKYTYANNLRIKEKCFSKERLLMGTIEYEYQ